MGFYRYIVEFWNEYKDDGSSGEDKSCGITVGKDLIEAMNHISHYYGDKEILNIHIYPLEESPVYDFHSQNIDSNYFTLEVKETGVTTNG